VYRIMVWKTLRKLGRPSRRGEDSMNTDLKETGWKVWAGFI
jgi:hypothetical protein